MLTQYHVMKKIIGGSSSSLLAKKLAIKMNVELANVTSKRFPDGELYVKINDKIDHAIIVQNTYPDNNIIELFLLQDATKRIANRIDVIIPYYGYGRQDKTFYNGEAISAEKIARLIQQDSDKTVIINPHKDHIINFFSRDAFICDGIPAIAGYFKGKVDAVIAPDKGALEMAKKAAEIIGCEYNYFEKTRISGSEVNIEIKNMNVVGKELLILDDIISTGGTMIKAVEILRNQDASRIYAACVHGLFMENADTRILQAGCSEIVTTDTIETNNSKVSVANELAKMF